MSSALSFHGERERRIILLVQWALKCCLFVWRSSCWRSPLSVDSNPSKMTVFWDAERDWSLIGTIITSNTQEQAVRTSKILFNITRKLQHTNKFLSSCNACILLLPSSLLPSCKCEFTVNYFVRQITGAFDQAIIDLHHSTCCCCLGQ